MRDRSISIAIRRTSISLLGLSLLCSTAFASDHHILVQEYAVIVGDAAIAAKRCNDVTVDFARLAIEGRHRAIGQQDVPTLRALAQERIDIVDASLTDEASVREWCDDALVGYGPGGLAVDGLLVP